MVVFRTVSECTPRKVTEQRSSVLRWEGWSGGMTCPLLPVPSHRQWRSGKFLLTAASNRGGVEEWNFKQVPTLGELVEWEVPKREAKGHGVQCLYARLAHV